MKSLGDKLKEDPQEIGGRRVERTNRMDGVKFIFADGSWLLVRPFRDRTGSSHLRRNQNQQRTWRCYLSRVINSYWVDERIRAQRVVPKASSPFASVREISADIIGTPAEVRRRGGVIPAWVVFGMIILGTFAVCVAVTMRTRTRMSLASQQYMRMQGDVEELRSANQF